MYMIQTKDVHNVVEMYNESFKKNSIIIINIIIIIIFIIPYFMLIQGLPYVSVQ